MLHVLDSAAAGAVGYAKYESVDYTTIDLYATVPGWDTDGTVTAAISSDNGTTWHTFLGLTAGTAGVITATNANEILHWGNSILRFTVGGGSGSVDVDLWVGGSNVIAWSP